MSDQGFAKVGDVIELGEPIPNNVVRMRDAATVEPNEHWSRSDTNPAAFQYLRADGTYGPETSVAQLIDWPKWWPMRVLAVAAPLARVGDVIAHGQAIPANVVRMRDCDGDRWRRSGYGWFCYEFHGEPYSGSTVPGAPDEVFWPMTVVEVDPELQPAARCCSGMIQYGQHDRYCPARPDPEPQPAEAAEPVEISRHCQGCGNWMPPPAVHKATCPEEHARQTVLGIQDAIAAAESGPVVLSLPQVPPGTVALVGDSSGARFLPTGTAWAYDQSPTGVIALGGLLDAERSVTVEFTPPCEPRTWPKIVDEATSDLPDVVDVIGDGRWHRLTEPGAEHLYARPGHEDNWRLSLRGLREWGEVREVLT